MKVLIAEDDVVSRRILQATLVKWGYEVVACSDGSEAWQVLQDEDAPRLVILDWVMPGMDGVQLCSEIRKRTEAAYIYILLLTAKNQRQDIIVGLEAGADDYLTKPFDSQELKVRLRAGSRILDLQTELISARDSLRFQATHDPLTGLWNRVAILDILNRELARNRRSGSQLGLIMVDVDHFKTINDTCGHLAGDVALREIARRMRASMRSYDEIGRYGGEEFLVVAAGCTAPDTLKLAERLRSGISEEGIVLPGRTIMVAGSLGVASSSECREVDEDWLLRAADAALYLAKQRGRNRVELFCSTELASMGLSEQVEATPSNLNGLSQ
jgi:two-component system cell cycle response regulator